MAKSNNSQEKLKCFWCEAVFLENQLLYDDYAEPKCPKCGASGCILRSAN